VLTKDQANAASEVLLAGRRKEQERFAETIATKFVPFSTWLRYGITGTTGVLIGVMFGSGQPGGIFLWSVIGLGAGTVVGFWLGRIRSRREA